jgi:hypothetical protein
MTGKETCAICGNPNANVAYYTTGMTAVIYHHTGKCRVAMSGESYYATPGENE